MADNWTGYDPTWQSLNSTQRAAAMALLEPDPKSPDYFDSAKNALGAMINRSQREKTDLGEHVSRNIYQPTIEPDQRARLSKIIRTPEFNQLVDIANQRISGQVPDWVGGATHYLAKPEVMLALEKKEPNKYLNWGPRGQNWTGYDPNTGQYKNQVFEDSNHAFLAPEGKYSADYGAKGEATTPTYVSKAPPQSQTFLQGSADALGRIPSDLRAYYNNIPQSSGDHGPYNTIINGSNALMDGAIRTITRGQFGIADPLKAIGLPTGGLEQGIQDFHAAYPYGQVLGDIGQFAGAAGPAGVTPPQITGAVSRGAQLANRAAESGATAFEDAAAAQRQGGLGAFAPVLPGDPRYQKALDLRNAGKTNQKIWNETKTAETPGAFYDPAGNLLTMVPDVDASLSPEISSARAGDATTLGKIYEHPQLYKEFPGLEDTKVNFVGDPRQNRMGLPVVYTKNGEINIPVSEAGINTPDLYKRIREQLVKATHYLSSERNPLNAEAFRNAPRYEEGKLRSLNGRLGYLIDKTSPSDPSYRPLLEYRDYINGYIDRVDKVKSLVDDPESFVSNPLVASTPFGKTLSNRVMGDAIAGREPKISIQDSERVIAEALHNLSSGSQGARHAIKRAETPIRNLVPPYQEGFPRSLARIAPEASDQDIRRFAQQWFSHGSGKEFVKGGSSPLDKAPGRVEAPIEPYVALPGRARKAEGGRVSMDDGDFNLRVSDLDDQSPYQTYRNRVNALRYLSQRQAEPEETPPLPEESPNRNVSSRWVVTESPGMHYGEYNPLSNRQYMAYADVAKKPPQTGGEDSFERLGGGDANLGFLIHLHNKGNPEATEAIRAIDQGRGDAGFWAKHLTKNLPGYAAGGSVFEGVVTPNGAAPPQNIITLNNSQSAAGFIPQSQQTQNPTSQVKQSLAEKKDPASIGLPPKTFGTPPGGITVPQMAPWRNQSGLQSGYVAQVTNPFQRSPEAIRDFAAGGSVNAPANSSTAAFIPGLPQSPANSQPSQYAAPAQRSDPSQLNRTFQPNNPMNQVRQMIAGGGSQGRGSPWSSLSQGAPMAQVTNPFQNNPGVTGAFAGGGQVADYKRGGRTRKVAIPGVHDDQTADRIAANTGSSIGPYGGYIPPPLNAKQASPQQGQQTYASGGEVTDSPDGNAHIDQDGMVRDPADSGVTTDQIAATVPEDSHIIPYNALVKLGDGDPELGKQRLLEYIKHLAEDAEEQGGESEKSDEAQKPAMKKGGKPEKKNHKPVDIMISNKELVLTPDKVKKIGGGDIEKGHHELNKMRMKLRSAR